MFTHMSLNIGMYLFNKHEYLGTDMLRRAHPATRITPISSAQPEEIWKDFLQLRCLLFLTLESLSQKVLWRSQNTVLCCLGVFHTTFLTWSSASAFILHLAFANWVYSLHPFSFQTFNCWKDFLSLGHSLPTCNFHSLVLDQLSGDTRTSLTLFCTTGPLDVRTQPYCEPAASLHLGKPL